MTETGTLHDAFIDELRDTYDAEKQLTKALPKLAKAAANPKLRAAFETHLKETQGQIGRLEQVFASLDEKVRGKHCDGIAGIIEEGKSIMTYARLAETGGLQWPCTAARPDGTPRLYTDLEFPTSWNVSESYEKNIATGHEHTMREYREKKDPNGRAVFVAGDYQPPIDSTDDEFPMIATTGRLAYHWHTRSKSARSPWWSTGGG